MPEAGDKGRLLPLCFKYGGQPKVGGRDLTSPMRQTPGRRQKEVGPEVDGRHLRTKMVAALQTTAAWSSGVADKSAVLLTTVVERKGREREGDDEERGGDVEGRETNQLT